MTESDVVSGHQNEGKPCQNDMECIPRCKETHQTTTAAICRIGRYKISSQCLCWQQYYPVRI